MTPEQLIVIQYAAVSFYVVIRALRDAAHIWKTKSNWVDGIGFLGLLVIAWWGLKFLVISSVVGYKHF